MLCLCHTSNYHLLCLQCYVCAITGSGDPIDYLASPTLVVLGGAAASDVQAGGTFTCALTTIGDIFCFGDNSKGQLGINSDSKFLFGKLCDFIYKLPPPTSTASQLS